MLIEISCVYYSYPAALLPSFRFRRSQTSQRLGTTNQLTCQINGKSKSDL